MRNTSSGYEIIKDENSDITKKAKLYIDVFGEAPRNEGRVDAKGNLYPLSEKPVNIDVNPFYNQEDLEAERKNLVTKKDGYLGHIAKFQEELVGFINGWKKSLDELNNDKFHITKQTWGLLMKHFENKYKTTKDDPIFYLAELGVLNSMRGQGLGQKLFETLDQDIQKEYDFSILRTTDATYVPSKKPFGSGGYDTVHHHNDVQQRIIMAKQFT